MGHSPMGCPNNAQIPHDCSMGDTTKTSLTFFIYRASSFRDKVVIMALKSSSTFNMYFPHWDEDGLVSMIFGEVESHIWDISKIVS